MKDHEHTLWSISLVFSAHTLGMFTFSILLGKLVDGWGRGSVILIGTGISFTSLVLAPASSAV